MEPEYYDDPRQAWGNSSYVCRKTDPNVVYISYFRFMDAFLPGPGLSPEQKEQLRGSRFLEADYEYQYYDSLNIIEEEDDDEEEDEEDDSEAESDADDGCDEYEDAFQYDALAPARYVVEYPALCKALNAVLALAESPIVCKDITRLSGKQAPDVRDRRPALALYESHEAARAAYTLPADADLSKADEGRRAHLAAVAWPWMLSTIEIAKSDSQSAFGSGGTLCETGTTTFRTSTYRFVTRVFKCQQRQHLFTVHISGQLARLARWDRAGCVITEPIDLRGCPELLLDFVYRLARASRAQQGYDPHAQLATPDEVDKLKEYKTENKWLKEYHESILKAIAEYPIYKIHCNPLPLSATDNPSAAVRPTPRAFLIGKPLNSGSADVQVHGDGIRPYIGYDLLENRLVFVKDYWRDRDSYQELDAYQRLQENNAQYVATAIAGGDVGGTTPQRTVNQMYMHNQYAYIHHIVVLKEVCRPLATYENSGVLLAAIYHGVIGHREAWESAGVLHCDISHNNIMIDVEADDSDVKGVLLDFDHCRFREDIARNGGKRCWRVGTEPYHSILTLDYQHKPKEVADDLESIVYLFMVFALRFAQHRHSLHTWKLSTRELARMNGHNGILRMRTQFFGSTAHDKRYAVFGNVHYPVKFDNRNQLLHDILRDLDPLLREHVLAADTESLAQYLPVPPKPKPAQPPPPPPPQKSTSGSPVFLDPWGDLVPKLSPEEAAAQRERWRQERAQEKREEEAKQAREAAKKAAARRVLDTHDAMLAVLERIVRRCREVVKGRRLVDVEADKTRDQFLGLGGPLGESWSEPRRVMTPKVKVVKEKPEKPPKEPSKRKAEEPPPAHCTRAAKKRREGIV